MAKFKILKTGETDINSTDIWRFCMHSDYPTQKVYTSGQTTLTISANNNTGTTSISHSLGYAPTVMAMFETKNSRFVKVFGETKATISAEAEQYFLVDISANYIVQYSDLNNPSGSLINCNVSVNDKVRFKSSTALPSPLQPNTDYYVKSIHSATYPGPQTVNVFDVSATQGGPQIDITDSGGSAYLVFYNITNPDIVDFDLIYSVDSSSSNVTFNCNPAISTPLFENNTDITIYYIILYDEI